LFVVLADFTMLALEAASSDGFSFGFLRLLRLARLARSARAIRFFPQLAIMVQGLIATLRIVMSGLLLLAVMLGIIGVLAVQLLHPINMRVAEKGFYDDCERCPRAFESTFNAAMTFTQQVITGDSWGAVSLPIIEESPLAGIFIMAVFVCLNLMVMNVILSMVVDSSLKACEEDTKRRVLEKEKVCKENAEALRNMCFELDEDRSGVLTKQELLDGFEHNPAFGSMMHLMDVSMEDLDAIFGILDKDGSGDVSYDEFVDELYKMKTHDSHTLLVFIKHYVSEINKQVQVEFSRLSQTFGGAFLEASPKQRLLQDSCPPVHETFHSILEDIRTSLRSDMSQMAKDLAKRTEDQHTLLAHLHRLCQRIADDAGACPRAVPLPKTVPQPMFDAAGQSLEVATAPRSRSPWERKHQNIPGPFCHYVGRGKTESGCKIGVSSSEPVGVAMGITSQV